MNNYLKPAYLLILSFLLSYPLFSTSCKGKPEQVANDTLVYDAEGKMPYDDTTDKTNEEEYEMEAEDVEIISQ